MKLMPHQMEGIHFALDRKGAAIGFEQGCGKTAVAICSAFSWLISHPSWSSVLVVAPSSLCINWQLEIEAWMKASLIKQDWTIGIVTDCNSFPETNFVICSYDKLHRPGVEEHIHRDEAWDVVILDEAQYIQNMTSLRCKNILGEVKRDKKTKEDVVVVKPLRARRKLALSGTFLMNKVINLFPILKWLQPDKWNYWAFAIRYCGGERGFKNRIMVNGSSNLPELHRRLTSGPDAVLIRRLKKDVLKDLPDKMHRIISLPPPENVRPILDEEKKIYALREDIIKQLNAAAKQASVASTDEHRERIQMLRKQRFSLFGQISAIRKQLAITKVPLAVAHVKAMLDSGVQKVLIFGTHRSALAAIADSLSDYGSQLLLGGSHAVERNDMVVKFQTDPAMRVFVLSAKAGGTGLTLHAASNVVIFEPNWTDAADQQAVDRAHRYGQTKGVVCDWMAFEESIDIHLLQTSLFKAHLADQVIDGKKSSKALPAQGKRDMKAIGNMMSDAEIKAAQAAIRHLAAKDVLAQRHHDGTGFSEAHRSLGHKLSAILSPTPAQAALMREISLKYREQLTPTLRLSLQPI